MTPELDPLPERRTEPAAEPGVEPAAEASAAAGGSRARVRRPARRTSGGEPYPAAAGRASRPGRSASIRSRAAGSGRPVVSELDKRIIEHLQEDGRRPFTQIAADLGVSESAVRARTNRLVEQGIIQIVGVTDPLKLGFAQMAMIGIRCEPRRLMEVAERIAAFPEVDYVVITAGRYDILIETVHEDNEALLRFLSEKLRTVDGVAETETFVYLRLVKQTYQWGTR